MDLLALAHLAESGESSDAKEISLNWKELATPVAIALSASVVAGLGDLPSAEAAVHCGPRRACHTKTYYTVKTITIRKTVKVKKTVKVCHKVKVRRKKVRRVRHHHSCWRSCYRACRPMRVRHCH